MHKDFKCFFAVQFQFKFNPFTFSIHTELYVVSSFCLQDEVLSETEIELQYVKDHQDDDEALLEGITFDLSKLKKRIFQRLISKIRKIV